MAQFSQGRYDDGLIEGVHFVSAALANHPASESASAEPFPWLEILWIIAGLTAFWVFLHSLQKWLCERDRDQAGGVGEVGYGGGGSFAAGLFATMTSNWVRDLFRSGRSVASRSEALPLTSELPPAEAESRPAWHEADLGPTEVNR
jgi:hypothetical protein